MLFMKSIPLRNKKRDVVDHALVDDEDYEFLMEHRWCKDAYGYAVSAFYINKKTVNKKMHRLITSARKGLEVDHINGNRLDNTRQNLRLCTRSQNCLNRGPTIRNTCGFKGVGWDKSRQKWRAQISVNGKPKFIGRFNTIQEAAKSYEYHAANLHGEFARLNHA